jgi:hypothetical protein
MKSINSRLLVILGIASIATPMLCINSGCSKTNRFKQVNSQDNFFTLDYKNDYHFDDLLNFEASTTTPDVDKRKGVTSDEALRRFLSHEFYNDKLVPMPI